MKKNLVSKVAISEWLEKGFYNHDNRRFANIQDPASLQEQIVLQKNAAEQTEKVAHISA
jgi:hypothetical protein